MSGMTASQIIRRAILKLGVIDPTQSITSQESQDGLQMLNVILAEWYTNSYIKQIDEMTIVTDSTVEKVSFGVDPSGNCDECPASVGHVSSINPLKVISAFTNQDTGVLNKQIQIVNRIDTQMMYKDIVSIYPEYASYQYGFETSYLHFWPKVSNGVSIKLFYLKPHEEITPDRVNIVVPMPPQYYNTMILDLANNLAADYGTSLSQTDYRRLMESKAAMDSLRSEPSPMARFDGGAQSVGWGAKYPYMGWGGSGRPF